ncbi:MAG: response regulator transcription factor [Halorhodospira sp.]
MADHPPTPNTRILLVDDDRELTTMLADYLGGEGFHVISAHDGSTALRQLEDEAYDAIVLDIMLPEPDGWEVLRRLRRHSTTPVLMLTARGDDIDTVVGLELGADDYLAKPCNPRVLVARLRALLRRSQGDPATAPQRLTAGDLTVDLGRRSAHLAGTRIALTDTELELLACLLRWSGHAVGKEQLCQEALGRKLHPYDRSIDWHISNLRRKLGPLPDGSERIKTVRSVGYQYVAG